MPQNNEALFQLAESFRQQNNIPMAVQAYNEILKQAPDFSIFGLIGLIFINMAKTLNSQGNIPGELDSLNNFMRCPLTAVTIDLVPQVKQRIGDLTKQMPQAVQVPK